MKVKETTQKQSDKDFEKNLSFEEWLEYFSKEPTSEELDNMENETYKAKNNPYYEPLQGA